MIVSHKEKFIFLKPRKVAGTSVQLALTEHCGDEDIITRMTAFSADFDEQHYTDPARNYEGWTTHMLPEDIKKKVGEEVWNSYTKITIVRNPWDRLVSQFLWAKGRGMKSRKHSRIKILTRWGKEIFSSKENVLYFTKRLYRRVVLQKKAQGSYEEFVHNVKPKYDNTPFYFTKNGEEVADVYLRYEHLQEDYNTLCEQMGWEQADLPRLKTKTRTKKQHYSTFYTPQLVELVSERYYKQITHFSYSFEDKKNKQ